MFGKAKTPSGKLGIYIHIPFCRSKCDYCDFYSLAGQEGRMDSFQKALLAHLKETAPMARSFCVDTIYFGGGTPTSLTAEQLARLMDTISDSFDLSGLWEYTVEAGRPDTVTAEKLRTIRSHGAHRISINPQTLEEGVLREIGRRHTSAQLLEAYQMARSEGFDSINMDLIAGLPGDSPQGFAASLAQVLDMGAENVTVHTLALKKGSRLMEDGGALPDGGEVAGMLDWSREILTARGYLPYYLYRQKYMSGSLENVGWARPGTGSLYNIVMMEELHTVVSLGAGGVTKLIGGGGKLLRLTNPKYPQDYLSGLDKVLGQKEEIRAFYQQ